MIESTAADILRIPVNKDGTIGAPEIYAQLQGNVLDGLAFARNGNLYVSCYYPNRIYRIFPDQNIELLIEDATGEVLNQPTNVAFEPKGTRLFFANLGGQHLVPSMSSPEPISTTLSSSLPTIAACVRNPPLKC